MSGFGFSLSGGAKRAGLSGSGQRRGPAKVADLFGADSDSDDGGHKDAKRARTADPATGGTSDAEVMEAAGKLAEFVAKNGRTYETMTRERNPAHLKNQFRFLHERDSIAYRFYESKISELQAAAATVTMPPASAAPSAPGPAQSRRSRWDATPAAPAPPGAGATAAAAAAAQAAASAQLAAKARGPVVNIHTAAAHAPAAASTRGTAEGGAGAGSSGGARAGGGSNTIAEMERIAREMEEREKAREAKKARDDQEEEDRRKRAEPLLNETSFDRRKVWAVYKNDGSRGHHMGDFIPEEELQKALAKGGDKHAQAAAEVLEKKNAIKSDNIGHKLLSKMGWKEGEAVGASGTGITAPIKDAGGPRDSRGLGTEMHGEIKEDDDPFEQYRKRMMLGYKYRPNPLGNPRKAYY